MCRGLVTWQCTHLFLFWGDSVERDKNIFTQGRILTTNPRNDFPKFSLVNYNFIKVAYRSINDSKTVASSKNSPWVTTPKDVASHLIFKQLHPRVSSVITVH